MQSNHYDLVLMDAHMPLMDGYTATRAMRLWETTKSREPIPILALTADAFQEARQASEAAGFNAHLTKPIAKSTLFEAIHRYATPCAHPLPMGLEPQISAASHDPFIASLAPRYLANIHKEIKKLQVAEIAADYTTIQRIAHNLHGNGASFGFPRITEIGAAIEQAARDQNLAQIRLSSSELPSYINHMLTLYGPE